MKCKLYRNGHVHVMQRQCDSCIFRPDTPIPEARDRVTAEAIANGTAVICHSTLQDALAVCHGFFKRHPTPTLRLAQAMGVIEYDSAEGRHP